MKKTSFMAKLLCLLLICLMFLPLVACGNETENPNPEQTTEKPEASKPQEGGENTNEPGQQETEYKTHAVPSDVKYNNTVKMLYWEDQEHEEFISEGESGDLVMDALYERNLSVSETLGVTIEYIPQLGDADNVSKWVSYVDNSLKGGYAFDIMGGYSRSTAACAQKKLCYNLLDDEVMTYLTVTDEESPWWPVKLAQQAIVNDKLYFCSGDISANALYMMYACFVNTGMLDELHLENPQDLVKRNEWTYDQFFNIYCKNVYQDLDGDEAKSAGDRIAFHVNDLHLDVFFYGCGVNILNNVDGEVSYDENFLTGNRVIETIEMVGRLLYSSNEGLWNDDAKDAFNEGRSLFHIDRCRVSIRTFDNENTKFVVVPTPKYTADLPSYYTTLGNPFTLYALPYNCQMLEECGALLEVMAAESYRTVTPALFEVTLKVKKVEDEVSGEMYDIIRETLVFDIGRIYDDHFGYQSLFRNMARAGTQTWASTIKSQKRTMNTKLDMLLTSFED